MTPATRRRLAEVRDAYEEAHQAREDAIVEAYHKGGGMREIAEAVGMSHPGVGKLLERLGVRKRWLSIEDANREIERRDRIEREQRGGR
jgi:DNA-binding transcriptional regulator LsrR (DeoR family)